MSTRNTGFVASQRSCQPIYSGQCKRLDGDTRSEFPKLLGAFESFVHKNHKSRFDNRAHCDVLPVLFAGDVAGPKAVVGAWSVPNFGKGDENQELMLPNLFQAFSTFQHHHVYILEACFLQREKGEPQGPR